MLIAALLVLAPEAVTAQPVSLTTLRVTPVSVATTFGPVRLAGRVMPAAPLASGRVLVWGTATPLPSARPAPEAISPTAAASSVAAAVPAEVALRAVFPNPLTARARVPYELPEPARVRLSIYDALGRQVAVLADGDRPAGWHSARLDASALAPGVYHVRLTAGAFVGASRFTIVR